MRSVLAVALALLATLAPATLASAHAVLLESSPARNAVLADPPDRISLRFNEPITAEFNPIAVYNQQGERVDAGNGRVLKGNARMVTVDLPPLPDGLYSVTYRVTSLDGHLVTDTFAFTVGPALASETADEAAEPALPQVPPLVGLAHGLTQAAALGLAGLAAFVVIVWRPVGGPQPRSLAWTFAALAAMLVLAGLLELCIYAVRASGEPFSLGLLWQALVRARAGRYFLARSGFGLLTAGAARWAVRRDGAPSTARVGAVGWSVAALSGLVLLATLTGQSHAAAAGGVVPLLVDWLHMAAISPWVGGLLGFTVLLPATLRQGHPQTQRTLVGEAVPRFSRLAIVAVLLMALTGLYSAQLHVPAWSALWTTTYGRWLLLKLGLLAPVLLLGAINLFQRGRGALRRYVALELLLVAGIFIATGFVSSLPPAQWEMDLRAGPFEATHEVDGLTITLFVTPAKFGYNESLVTLSDAAGQPVTDASVGLRLTMPGHDMGKQNPEAVELGHGRYEISPVVFGMAGPWDVEVAILTPQGREVRTTFRLRIPLPLGP